MSDEIKNILSDNDGTPGQQQLLNYLQGKLDSDAEHELEQQITDSEFVNDAVEGLQSFKPGADINSYVNELNRQLQVQLQKNKSRKAKRRLKENPWIYFTLIAIIIIIIIIGYELVKKYLGA
jgi:hypothetical protein